MLLFNSEIDILLMTKKFIEFSTHAMFQIENDNETLLESYKTIQQIGAYAFVWTTDSSVEIIVDHVPVILPPHSILSLTPLQYFKYIKGDNLIMYQFNQPFYCIKEHDKELGCAGLLFFGSEHIPIVTLNEEEQQSFSSLHQIFLEEFQHTDATQAEMLRMLLSRFIIKTTRILKTSTAPTQVKAAKLDLVRQFNLLVEEHFKEEHSVTFYAEKLYKSPKTISNTFSKLNKSPLQIIHDRIVLEAKRQLTYTEKTIKEIAYDVGFEDASHLSRLFKKQTGMSPASFKATSM